MIFSLFFNLIGGECMNKYEYSGPVTMFGSCISNNWYGYTYAISKKKAKNNLTYQYKKQNNLVKTTKVCLPGNVIFVS